MTKHEIREVREEREAIKLTKRRFLIRRGGK